jgi:LPPG:FO 2-phospho-L-lactate transferase
VATEYLRLIDGFVIDHEDAHLAEGVRSLGMQVLVTGTVMRSIEDRVALARAVLDFARSVRETRTMEVE